MKAHGVVSGEDLVMDDDIYSLLKYKYRKGLGDVVEATAKPFAKLFNMDCLDADTKLKPDSNCAKRRDALNKLIR
jgi:hypothetical protein